MSLLVVSALAYGIGYSPTSARWGATGVQSMQAVLVICVGAAIVALIPMAWATARRPALMGHAALAGTALRLLLTIAGGAVYQIKYDPHLPSFLFWAAVVYLALLAVETVFEVLLVKRSCRSPVGARGASA